ncbi:HAD-IIIA family hydrolase [Allorhizocola rhizosphaerae]|uniref:HAD-IIIA family hydrolase n=1 Tax=Allorhizocola rhizosphaerae TaxID=1872709 RepID=UPI000E3BAEE4|nr:HAD-IIIA family hydrolase [Allorhizocola rhizosphaerae]
MRLFDAVLFDRDGTLIEDRPYNGDPEAVLPMPGAKQALDRLRSRGLKTGVVSNQSGIGRGLVSAEQVESVNRRVEELLGPFDCWHTCPHAPDAGCACRKPNPGLIRRAAATLGTTPGRCVVVGDIDSDVQAALACGALPLMVPTEATRVAEVATAPAVVRDLTGAADWVLARMDAVQAEQLAPSGRHVLAVRTDGAGDLLLCGPAIRAIAHRAARVTVWAGQQNRVAARLLPGVDEVVTHPLPWIDARPRPFHFERVVESVGALGVDEAIVFTSYHQSALPTALVLREAGVPRVSAISADYPGSLLDVRHRVPDDLPEPVRALSLAAAAGYPLPSTDDGHLRVVLQGVERGSHVVLHPGGSAPARACSPKVAAEFARRLRRAGYPVYVTGSAAERPLTAQVAVDGAVDLGGRTNFARLAKLLAGAACLVTGNTGPAHLASAVGTPVVSLFAPTIAFGRWGPYRTAVVRLGDQLAACRDTRALQCPVPGHPCLDGIDPDEVVRAVGRLVR